MKDILATGLLFPEGPAILSDGTVLCSEQGASQITIAEGEGGKVYAKTGGSPNAAIVGANDIVVKVFTPDGKTAPENEKPSQVVLEVLTVQPALDASPPLASVNSAPVTSN